MEVLSYGPVKGTDYYYVRGGCPSKRSYKARVRVRELHEVCQAALEGTHLLATHLGVP